MPPEPQPEPAPPREREESPGRPAQPPTRGSAARWAGGIVLALVLYVLSTGPAARLVQTGHVSILTTRKVYAPILWVRDHTKIGQSYLRPALEWYCRKIWKTSDFNLDTGW
jgi:hypothetical protein